MDVSYWYCTIGAAMMSRSALSRSAGPALWIASDRSKAAALPPHSETAADGLLLEIRDDGQRRELAVDAVKPFVDRVEVGNEIIKPLLDRRETAVESRMDDALDVRLCRRTPEQKVHSSLESSFHILRGQ